MTQDHLVIDFPIRGPANAKALNDELPPLMPDFARVQDDLGNVHFSRFMIEGDENLLSSPMLTGSARSTSSGWWTALARCSTRSLSTSRIRRRHLWLATVTRLSSG